MGSTKRRGRHTKTAIVEKDVPTQKAQKGSVKKGPTRQDQKGSARKGPTQKAMPAQMNTTVKKTHQKRTIVDTASAKTVAAAASASTSGREATVNNVAAASASINRCGADV